MDTSLGGEFQMHPQLTSGVAVALLIIGLAAVLIMLELKGYPKDRIGARGFIRAHKTLGYLFFIIFAGMLYVMIRKVSAYQEDLSPRVVLHIALALALVPLAAVKIIVVRRYRLFTSYLLLVGGTIFLGAFVLNGLTAGYFFLHRSDIRYTAITDLDAVVLDEDLGRRVVNEKCGKCHTLERVFRTFKRQEGWTETVNRMALLDAPNIRDFDVKQSIHFLLKQQERREDQDPRRIEDEIGDALVSRKCSLCHNLDQVYKAVKTEDEWLLTVERMIKHAFDPEFLKENEKKELVRYLSRRGEPG
jgi:hypothetical protein